MQLTSASVCVCVCVCVCKLNTASDWLTNSHSTLANHHHLCGCPAPPSSLHKLDVNSFNEQLQFVTRHIQ